LHINGKEYKFPNLQTWGETDPISELSQKYYEQGDKEKGKYYWRKKTDLLRALIIKDPLPADDETGEKAEGKVKKLIFSFQLMEALNTAIADEEIKVEPWDLKNGYNFKIVKSAMPGKDKDGKKQYNYTIGSGFERSPSDISDKDIELIDLRTLLPEKPSREKIDRLLTAHLTGEDVVEDSDDNDGSSSAGDTAVKETTKVTETPVTKTETVQTPVVETEKETGGEDADDELIAQIMARRKNKAG
jgi:hypothetical protein